jgi:hypothetical protein
MGVGFSGAHELHIDLLRDTLHPRRLGYNTQKVCPGVSAQERRYTSQITDVCDEHGDP